jgi:hypothetical protein
MQDRVLFFMYIPGERRKSANRELVNYGIMKPLPYICTEGGIVR